MFVRNRRPIDMFLWMSIVLTIVGLVPMLVLEFIAPPVLTQVPLFLVGAGFFEATYYFCLARSFHTRDFTVAYPLARALPVVFVALLEFVTGTPITGLGWAGILLIAFGSLLLPLQSLRELEIKHYWHRGTVWILLTALSITGYTLVDSHALRQLPSGLPFALRYGILQATATGVMYWLLLRVVKEPVTFPARLADWRFPAFAMFFVLGSYSLVLWAYQSNDPASYIIGLRQISIVIGVIAGAYFFHERGARLRIPAAILITLGVVILSLA